MNLKRVEIYGFKSFAEKFEINLDKGITAIVGPNGCGKSNVADAIRWVLGEQSPKNLRGKNMQDVIFAGTERRKSLSYCEVSLVFDNTNRIFAIEYDELIITRKLYRSGDSEYLLNRTSCRLKDILDLMRDTGLGKEGYSIIGQGKVEEIVNSRSDDRRAIFEEATGIAKFKSRKIESERKLARTRDNIERLKDIISELERQRTPLEKQAEDAKIFLKLRDELKYHEINTYLYHYENNAEAIEAVNNRIAAIDEEIALRESENGSADLDYANKSAEINNIDVYSAKLRDEQTELMVNAEKLSGEGRLRTERIKNLEKEKERILGYIEENKDALLSKSDEIAGLTEYYAQSEEDLKSNKAQYDAMEAEFLALSDEILAREQELDASSKAMMDAMNELSDIKADNTKLRTERESLLERQDEARADLEGNRRVLEEQEKNKADILRVKENMSEQIAKLKGERDKLSSKANENKFDINRLNDEIRTLHGSLVSLETRRKMLEEIKNGYDGFQIAVKKLMQASKTDAGVASRIEGVVADIIKVPDKYETAIETALGGALQNIVTKNEEDAQYLIELLKRERYGRVTFLPMTSFKHRELESEFRSALREKGCCGVASELVGYDNRYSSIVSGLLGRTVVCEDMDSAVAIARRYRYAFRIVTVQGELLNPSGAITGGSKKTDASNILSQEREITETQNQIKKVRFSYEKKLSLIKELQKENDVLLDKLKDVEEDLKDAEISYATECEKEDKAQQKIDETLEDMKKLDTFLATVEMKLAYINDRLASVDKQQEDVASRRSSTDDVLEKNKRLSSDKKARKEELEQERSNLRVTVISIQKELDGIKSDIARLKKEAEDIEHENLEYKSELIVIDTDIRKLVENVNETVVSEKDKKRNDDIKAELANIDDYKKKLQQEMSAILEKKDEISKLLVDLNARRTKEEGQFEKIDANMAALQEHIREDYELDYEGCKPFKDDNYDLSSGNQEINRLRKSISRLGPVNTTAIETFKEVDGRYRELNAQYDDLVKSEADILQVIADLSKEMLSKFTVEFNKINENFKVIFKELFNGGQGVLVLDTENCTDPLEAGIEIMAQPPGKKMQSMSLYSGGEKALIAIAILFAILRSKPMPFCVLDEVEAALDESNAGLIAKHLKRFSDDTQFIVITHRKPTMELADRLYGVTMEEKGVSKMVSVKLSEAVRHAESKKTAV